MTEPSHRKPPPARPEPAEPGKPTPERELVGDPPAAPVEADVPEAEVEREGQSWTVRVTGRSGRADEGSTPLLLLGFWRGEAGSERPDLEAWVVARALKDLSSAALDGALSTATEPPDPDLRKPFFPGTNQTRRRGSMGS
jgi:hypothetical protein